jgi:hypothetical protein
MEIHEFKRKWTFSFKQVPENKNRFAGMDQSRIGLHGQI